MVTRLIRDLSDMAIFLLLNSKNVLYKNILIYSKQKNVKNDGFFRHKSNFKRFYKQKGAIINNQGVDL